MNVCESSLYLLCLKGEDAVLLYFTFNDEVMELRWKMSDHVSYANEELLCLGYLDARKMQANDRLSILRSMPPPARNRMP